MASFAGGKAAGGVKPTTYFNLYGMHPVVYSSPKEYNFDAV
jgi:hypothetical protein